MSEDLAETMDRQRVEELTTRFSEPTWLADNRVAAYEAYLQTPMPTQKDEDWRRTDLSNLDLTKLRAFDLGPAKQGVAPELPNWFSAALSNFDKASGVLFQTTRNGGYLQLNEDLRKKGVIFCDLATAIDQHPELIKQFFVQNVGGGKFHLMTKAFFNCGAFLLVPKNVQLDEPLLFGIGFSAHDTEFGGAIFPRLIILAEEHSKADIVFAMGPEVDSYTADGKPVSLSAGLVEVHVKTGAKISYLEVQDYAQDVFMIQNFSSHVSKDAEFTSLSVALGGKQTKSEIATYLQAPGATSTVLGAVFGNEQEFFNFNTIQEHNAPDTRSDINFRVALKDSSTSVYQGAIRVDKVAQRTNAFQSNKNLLLGADAKADSIPKLEILADDVKCSHGATVGPVDREQIFYLMSRGLTRSQSEELVVLGFFRQVLQQFPLTNSKEWLNSIVSRKIVAGPESNGLERVKKTQGKSQKAKK